MLNPICSSTCKVIINQRNLKVEIYGPDSGARMVLLHHGLGSTRAWKAQITTFVDAGFQVMAYDRWGYGGSDPRPALDVPSFNTDLADLSVLVDQYQNIILVGHSDGGTLALYYAAQFPRRVVALVTVAAHIYVEPKMLPGIEAVQYAFAHDKHFHEGLHRMHGEKTDSVFNNWYSGWHKSDNLSWDMRPLLGKINCPALIIQGLEDEHATPEHARDIAAAIPNARLWLVEGAGHMFPQQKPEMFNHAITSFLQNNVIYPADKEHPASKHDMEMG